VRSQDRLQFGDRCGLLAGQVGNDVSGLDAGLGGRSLVSCDHADSGRLAAGVGDGLRSDAE
jgi:hypothetical protein